MATGNTHVAVAIISGALVAWYIDPLAGWALALGNLAPDLDEFTNKKWGTSWITHTAVFPSFLAMLYQIQPALFKLGNIVPPFTFGMLMHVFMDFIWYESHKMEKDVMSSLFGKIPTALAMVIAVLPHLPFLFFGLL